MGTSGVCPSFASLLPLFRWEVSAWLTTSTWGTSGVYPSFKLSSLGRSRPGGLGVLRALPEFAPLLPLFRWEVSAWLTTSTWGISGVCVFFSVFHLGGLGLADFEYLGPSGACPSFAPLPVGGLAFADYEYLRYFRSLPLFCPSSGGRSRPGGLRVLGAFRSLPLFCPSSGRRSRLGGLRVLAHFRSLLLFCLSSAPLPVGGLGLADYQYLAHFRSLPFLYIFFTWEVSAWRTWSTWGFSRVCPSFAPLPMGGLGLADYEYLGPFLSLHLFCPSSGGKSWPGGLRVLGAFRSLPLCCPSSGGRSRLGGLRVLAVLPEFALLLPLFRWELSVWRTTNTWALPEFALLPLFCPSSGGRSRPG